MATSKIVIEKATKTVYMSYVIIQAYDYMNCTFQKAKIVNVPKSTKMNVYHYEQNRIAIYSYSKQLKINQIRLFKKAISILNNAANFLRYNLKDLLEDAQK